MSHRVRGFTLVELMITIVIVAIGVALAVPTWTFFVEKREVTAAAEEFANFITFARSEAVKRNEEVFVSWYSPGGHNANWCVGLSLEDDCDCREGTWSESDFCTLDDTHTAASPHNVFTQTNFAGASDEMLHMNSQTRVDSFSFDPIRGILSNVSTNLATEIAADDDIFYLHSSSGSGGTRYFEVQIRLNLTGRIEMCTDDDRQSVIGGYPVC